MTRPVGGRAAGDPASCRRCASELEQVRREIEEAERSYDLNRAAELRHGRLPELERRLQAEEERLRREAGRARCCARRSPRTRSPRSSRAGPASRVARLIEGEREKLLRLDEVLHERVIGQDEAVQLVADAVIRARAGHQGPAAPDRLVHLPRPDRRRQDRARRARSPRRCSTPRTTSSASTCPSTRSATRSAA